MAWQKLDVIFVKILLHITVSFIHIEECYEME